MRRQKSKTKGLSSSFRILYIEPFSGAAGDMFVAALLGLGADTSDFWKRLRSLPLKEKWNVSFEDVVRCKINAKRFSVAVRNTHHHRTLKDIEKIIRSADLTDSVSGKACLVFKRLAEAEAKVHGGDSGHVHFHEIGAADAIIDIVGVCLALELLQIDYIISSPATLGKGIIDTSHGRLPVPAPATLKLLEGFPVIHSNISAELTTPTGAALLTTLVNEWDIPPEGMVIKTANGAGQKDLDEQPNILRATIYSKSGVIPDEEAVGVIETNMDDFPGEQLSWIGPKLLEKGAYDYAIIPVTMKKSRQGIILQVLCPISKIAELTDFILSETSTFGVRYRVERRRILQREIRKINTPWGEVVVKFAIDKKGNCLKCKPEYESCASLAETAKTSYSVMYRQLSDYIEKWKDEKNELNKKGTF